MILLLSCLPKNEPIVESQMVNTAEYVVQWSGLSQVADLYITRFEVVLYSIRLPYCQSSTAMHTIGLNSALAGHSEINISSDWQSPFKMNLMDSDLVEVTTEFPPQQLCHLATTYARWDGSTMNIDNFAEDSFSILLEGQCLGDSVTQFRLETKVPAERVLDITSSEINGSGSVLMVKREFILDKVLDGLDCKYVEDWSASDAIQLLSNLHADSNLTMELHDVE